MNRVLRPGLGKAALKDRDPRAASPASTDENLPEPGDATLDDSPSTRAEENRFDGDEVEVCFESVPDEDDARVDETRGVPVVEDDSTQPIDQTSAQGAGELGEDSRPHTTVPDSCSSAADVDVGVARDVDGNRIHASSDHEVIDLDDDEHVDRDAHENRIHASSDHAVIDPNDDEHVVRDARGNRIHASGRRAGSGDRRAKARGTERRQTRGRRGTDDDAGAKEKGRRRTKPSSRKAVLERAAIEESDEVVRDAGGNRIHAAARHRIDPTDEPRADRERPVDRRSDRDRRKTQVLTEEDRRRALRRKAAGELEEGAAAPAGGNELHVVRDARGNRKHIRGPADTDVKEAQIPDVPEEKRKVEAYRPDDCEAPSEEGGESNAGDQADSPDALAATDPARPVARDATGNRSHTRKDGDDAERPQPRRVQVPLYRRVGRRKASLGVVIIAILLALGAIAFGLRARTDWNDLVEENQELTDPSVLQAPARPERPPAATPVERARLERNDRGEVVRVRAPTADAVLVGFCQQTTECHPFYPKELGVPANATPGTRVGLFGHPSADGTLAIYISRDRRDGSWIAGDGRSPIQLKDASRILLEGQPIVVGD